MKMQKQSAFDAVMNMIKIYLVPIYIRVHTRNLRVRVTLENEEVK